MHRRLFMRDLLDGTFRGAGRIINGLIDVSALGRFGDWEYINSDKCVMKALSLACDLRAHWPAK